MLSVVIATHDSERVLVPTLAALIAGTLAGVVHEVIVADAGSGDATAAIADGTGCRVLASPATRGVRLKTAAGTARAPWLLFLAPGVVPDANWADEARRFIEEIDLAGDDGARAAAFRTASAAFRPALIEALSLLRTAVFRPRDGQALLIAKTLYDALGGHRDVDAPERDLARRLGRRLVRLRTGATLSHWAKSDT